MPISAKGCHESVQNGWSHCPLTKLTKLKLGALPLLPDIVFPFCKYAVTPGHDGRASSGILPSVFQRLSARSQLPHDLILILVQFKLDGLSQGGRRWLSANVKNAFNSFVRRAYLLIYDKKRNFCAHYQNLWTLLSEAVLHWKLRAIVRTPKKRVQLKLPWKLSKNQTRNNRASFLFPPFGLWKPFLTWFLLGLFMNTSFVHQ